MTNNNTKKTQTKKKTKAKPAEPTRQEKLEAALDKAKTRRDVEAALTDPDFGVTTDTSFSIPEQVHTYLLVTAFAGFHKPIKFLRNKAEYKDMKQYLSSICKIAISTFKSNRRDSIRKYKKSLKNGLLPDIESLKSMDLLTQAINFYKDEQKIVKKMLFEYRCYRMSSLTVFNGLRKGLSRPKEDLVDYSNSGLIEEVDD